MISAFNYNRVLKRILDFAISLCLLVLLLPLFFLIALVLGISNKGKVFFIQIRPGKGEKLFKLIKFRTMNDKRFPSGEILPDYQRITKIGKVIRSFSLDELPQLFNVLSGRMSLIGPRPLLIDYLPLYTKEQSRRHEVRPGITGWAQVNGRNQLTWEEKFDLDLWYVKHISFQLDVKILFLTLIKVLSRRGVNANKKNTMERFNGSVLINRK